jgi:hypothetical protein
MIFLISDEYRRDTSSSMHETKRAEIRIEPTNKVKARLASQGLSMAVTPAKR